MRGYRLAPLALLALLMVGTGLCAAPARASPNPIPVMSLQLTPSGAVAAPDPVAPGFAQLSGTISIDKIPGERLAVYITGTVDTGWQVQCSPSVLLLTTNKMSDFTATVVVPPATPASSVGVLRVEAQAQGLGFFLRAVAEALVTVRPYYRVFLDSPMPYKEITPGAKTSFVLEVQNWGNSMDTFDIEISNAAELAYRGWLISFSVSSASRIAPMGTKRIAMYVQSPMVFTPWKAEATLILIRASSQNSGDTGELVEQSFIFVVYERGTYINEPGWALIASVILLAVLGSYLAVRRRRKRRVAPAEGSGDAGSSADED
ncbi:MAG: choice-of-anchor T family protein [Thermoplasmata archaeon]